MNADAFRQLYDYHFDENRKLWDDSIMALSQEQFTRKHDYSLGSIRNHIIHLISVDDTWFAPLRGVDIPRGLNPVHFTDRSIIRARWDAVERTMRQYLAALSDDMLLGQPFPEGEDEDLFLWQVLIHVVNHGTDHRAQMRRLLHDLGLKTGPQDFVFYAYDHPWGRRPPAPSP